MLIILTDINPLIHILVLHQGVRYYLQIKYSVQWIPGHFCGLERRSIDGKGNSPVYLQIPCQFVKNHFSVEANTNFNLLNMAVAVGMNLSDSKMPH